MNGTAIGGTIGSSIGTVVPVIGTITGGTIGTVLGGLVDIFSGIFSSEDEGHWEGNKFIPGDLENRIKTVNQWIEAYGLGNKIDWKIIEDILLTPGVWQDKIKSYLQQVKSQIQNKPATTNPETILITNQNPITTETKAAIDTNKLITIGLIGAGLYLIAKKKKR